MQSTKEEFHYARAFPPHNKQEEALLQHQKRLLNGTAFVSMKNTIGSEKVLVVLLVASATVCFLTNLLVLLILSLSTRRKYNRGRRVKLMLRYQLMRNQAIIGLFTAFVVVYPLKILALSFGGTRHQDMLEPRMEPRLQNNQVQMWTSTSSCFIFFTLPLVAGPLAILGHTLGIYAELLLRSWCLAKHALLMASPKSLIRGLQILMAWPFLLALLSLIPKMNHFSRICYRPWSLTYWCLVMAFIILLFGLLAAFWVFNYVMQKKPHLWSNSANDTTSLISTSSGFHSARFAGSRTQCSGREAKQTSSMRPKATVMVHTVDPPPLLDLSLPSANVLSFLINLLLYVPAFVHLRPLPSHMDSIDRDLASSDTFLLWSYVLILIGGSVTPVLHLMTDEAVSSLGLGILRKKNCLKKIRWLKNTGASDDPGHTNGNYNDEAL